MTGPLAGVLRFLLDLKVSLLWHYSAVWNFSACGMDWSGRRADADVRAVRVCGIYCTKITGYGVFESRMWVLWGRETVECERFFGYKKRGFRG